jgi:hypothetical protein
VREPGSCCYLTWQRVGREPHLLAVEGSTSPGEFSHSIQIHQALMCRNFGLHSSLFSLSQSHLPRSLRGHPSCDVGCSVGCSPSRSVSCGLSRSPDCGPGCSLSCCPRCSLRCSIRCCPGCSYHCGPSRHPHCPPDCLEDCFPNCPPSCSVDCLLDCGVSNMDGPVFERTQEPSKPGCAL